MCRGVSGVPRQCRSARQPGPWLPAQAAFQGFPDLLARYLHRPRHRRATDRVRHVRTFLLRAAALELRGISKRYPGCLANDRIDLCIDAGEIHALLGENGAGKSTLMKIIYGVTRPDAGEIRWQGEPVQVRDPARARALGIGMVFQHFSLFETLSVAENIALALGAEAGSPRRLEARIREVSQRYGMPLEPRRLVHGLSIGERQRWRSCAA